MNILVIGSGGREHAIGTTLAYSPLVDALFFAPGNAGTAQLGTNIYANNLPAIEDAIEQHKIDLIFFGNEQPLVEGWSDKLVEKGHKVVGCSQYAAQLEGSKSFAKTFMQEFGIPTAAYQVFTAHQYQEGLSYLATQNYPLVLKADGLAGGKGVLICQNLQEAQNGLKEILLDQKFGAAGTEVVIEAFLYGEEASVFAFCDGTNFVLLPAAQDHKRIGEGDTGLNTGGMGTYAPAPIANEVVMQKVIQEVVHPLLNGMKTRGHLYQGILFIGLMIENKMPSVVEFNCRLGDPETQVVLPLLKSDFAELCLKLSESDLQNYQPQFYDNAALCVVMASKGYPENFEKGFPITGLAAADIDGVHIFHAGTHQAENDIILSNSGRVLGVTGVAKSLKEAQEIAYQAVAKIDFSNQYFRRDIGHRAL